MENVLQVIDNNFGDLKFNESQHKYSVKGHTFKKSVSKVIEDFYLKFDTEKVSARVAKTRGITQDEVKAEWKATNKEAIDRGTRVHLFGELYPFNRGMKPGCPQEEAVVKFWNDLPEWILPVAMEVKMYHKLYMFPGTMDILLFNTKTQEYIIADYKTNKDLFKNFREKKMTGIFSNSLDHPFNHYQVQLSLYQILLEQIGIKVYKRTIIWLKLDGTYDMYDTEDLRSVLDEHLKLNYENR